MASIWELLPGPAEQPAVRWSGSTFDQSAFAVQELAETSIGLVLSAAAELGIQRSGRPTPEPIDRVRQQAIAAFSGHVKINGKTPPTWAELSGVYDAADGRHIQLHCNFPHHAAGVVAHLGTAADRAAVATAIAKRSAFELEAELIEKGMIAAAVRTLAEWDVHPHAEATQNLPLVEVTQIGGGPPRQVASLPSTTDRTAHGLRVLDCSRVLAGPVCGQTLAAAGADVLRIGAAHLPSVKSAVVSTGFGKRNAFVDFDTAPGLETMLGLAEDANVLIDAYRPGALSSRGLSPEVLSATSPGLVVIQLCAFDWTGPWSGRRGFDSIIQSTTGISAAGADMTNQSQPRPLRFQALDYATGFLAAFAALRMISHQQRVGGSWLVRLSLLRTRNWLLGLGGPLPFEPGPLPDLDPWFHTVESPFGPIEAPGPLLGHWDRPPGELGTSAAAWL